MRKAKQSKTGRIESGGIKDYKRRTYRLRKEDRHVTRTGKGGGGREGGREGGRGVEGKERGGGGGRTQPQSHPSCGGHLRNTVIECSRQNDALFLAC